MPGRLTPAAVRQQIARGEVEPSYLITGDDEVGIEELASAFEDTVESDLRAFNVQRFYGSEKDVGIAEVIDAAATLPLLASRRIVILLQAERLLTGRRAQAGSAEEGRAAEASHEGEDSQAPKGQLALLKQHLARLHRDAAETQGGDPRTGSPCTIVVAGAGLLRLFEPLADHAAVVVCEASFDLVASIAAEHGVRFDRGAVELFRQRAGAGGEIDGGRLRDDVERVLLFAAGRQLITRDMVAEVVGRPASGGAKKLWNELAARNTAAALTELRLELAEGGVPFMLLGLIRSAVERTVPPSDLPRAVDALMRTDLAIKTSAGDSRVLLERLVVEVCAAARDRR